MTTSPQQATSYSPTFLTLHEIVQKARQKLNHDNWDYIVGGTETETTVSRNRAAIDALAFKPRVLRDVSHVNTGTRFLGRDLKLPVLLAPVGSLEVFAEGAGATSSIAAGRYGVAHMLSSVCQPGIEATAAAAPDTLKIFLSLIHISEPTRPY